MENNSTMYRGSTLLSKEDILFFASVILKQDPARLKLDYRILPVRKNYEISVPVGRVGFLVSCLGGAVSGNVLIFEEQDYVVGASDLNNKFFNGFIAGSPLVNAVLFYYEISVL